MGAFFIEQSGRIHVLAWDCNPILVLACYYAECAFMYASVFLCKVFTYLCGRIFEEV